MAAPSGHVHITEREIKHTWPDGQQDDAKWEDCTFCALVELARLCHDSKIAATHAEAELLRDAAGEDPMGGTNIDDAIRGIKARYKWLTGWKKVVGFTALWTALESGYGAVAQGRTGVFPLGHRLRRWDPGFNSGHAVLIVRTAPTDRVWWCDPLAPKGTYTGEWVTKAELKQYVDSFGGAHLVAKIGGTMAIAKVTDEVPKLMDWVPGTELWELDGVTRIKKLANNYNGQVSPYAAGIFRAGYATLDGIKRPVLIKFYRNLRPVPTATTGYTKAQVDAARAEGVISGTQTGVTQGVDKEKSRLRAFLGL